MNFEENTATFGLAENSAHLLFEVAFSLYYSHWACVFPGALNVRRL